MGPGNGLMTSPRRSTSGERLSGARANCFKARLQYDRETRYIAMPRCRQ
jgi:hypothetical protein